MEMTPQDCGLDDGPVDPDLAWTRWALGSLGELVEIGLRSARMTATEQMATPITRTKPDFALAQVRLARSVRLSIAMSQRVRENYQDRKDGKAERHAGGGGVRRRGGRGRAGGRTSRRAEGRRAPPAGAARDP